MFTYRVDDDIELKLLEKYDATELIALINENRHYLREWLPWVDNMRVEADYYPVIEMWLKQFVSNDGFQVGIVYKGRIVGMVGFHRIDWNNRQTSIGYWLTESVQGHGIMTRSVRALINYAFHIYHLHRIEIRCATLNTKSRAIPERLGFKHEGCIQHGERLYEDYVNIEIYGLINE